MARLLVAAALMLGGASATATYYDHGTCEDYAIASDDVYTGAALGFEFDSLASTCCYTYDDNACSHTPTGVPTPMPSSAPTSAPTAPTGVPTFGTVTISASLTLDGLECSACASPRGPGERVKQSG